MNKTTKLIVVALCAYLLIAGSVSAQQRMVPEPAPVAGFSPNFADSQPVTGAPLATLTPDANRLIRWQGWLDVDAFSTSILNQMKKRLDAGMDGMIEAGMFTITEPAIAAAVKKAACNNPTFKMNEKLNEGQGENFQRRNIEPACDREIIKQACAAARTDIGTQEGKDESFQNDIELYVWLYRHNFADTGLFQLYISAKGKMQIGCQIEDALPQQPNDDIQGIPYEFGFDPGKPGPSIYSPVVEDIEIWRAVVVRVDATGAIKVVGKEAKAGDETVEGVVKVEKMSDWERAPSLENNPHYNPKNATGAAFVEPLDRTVKINANDVQVRTGSVQTEGRVNTVPVYRYRVFQ